MTMPTHCKPSYITDSVRRLSAEEREQVSGGMKWVRGTDNPDVIDARGGSIRFLGLIFTFDIDGNVSSVG